VKAATAELPFPPAASPSYVVEINECGIFASRIGIDFWTNNILLRPIGNRLVWLSYSPGGGVAQLPCADRQEAEFVCGKLLEHGIDKAHAKVKRLKAVAR
jgi:hypothetical protein